MVPFEQVISVALNPAVDRVVEVPGFHVGGHRRGRRITRYPAGKAINMARAMAALGQPSTVTGFIGQPEAEWYRQFLSDHGIEDYRVVAVAEPTRENITVVDPDSRDADTHIIEQGFTIVAGDVAQLRETLSSLASPGRLFAFCGSLPAGVTVAQFVEMLQLCLDGGAQVAVDASGAALEAAVELPLWLIKPNVEELAALIGEELFTRDEQLAAAKRVAARVDRVLLSDGARGATLIDAQEVHHACATIPTEDVVGTVGCGDALLGGFLSGWQTATQQGEADPGQFALWQGVAAATLAATQLERRIEREGVDALLRQMD